LGRQARDSPCKTSKTPSHRDHHANSNLAGADVEGAQDSRDFPSDGKLEGSVTAAKRDGINCATVDLQSVHGYRFGLRRRVLWKDVHAEAGGGGLVQNATLALLGLMIAFTYTVIDMHTERVTTGFDTLPQGVFWPLLFIAAVAVVIGGDTTGLSGLMCRYRMFAFILVLAATIHLIVDFDRSMRGFISISQEPMISTISDMEARLEK
jgi:hypothetical protein